jgi:hypothetical protein
MLLSDHWVMQKPSQIALAVQALCSYAVAGGLGIFLASSYEPMPTKVMFVAIPVVTMFIARYRVVPASSKVSLWQKKFRSDTQPATGAAARLQAL